MRPIQKRKACATDDIARTLLPYFRPYRGMLGIGLLLVIASSAFVSVLPSLLREALDRMKHGDR